VLVFIELLLSSKRKVVGSNPTQPPGYLVSVKIKMSEVYWDIFHFSSFISIVINVLTGIDYQE